MSSAAVNIENAAEVDLSSIIGTVQEVLPEELIVDEDLDVRGEIIDEEREQKAIEELALSIAEEGQLQDGSAFPTVDASGVIQYHLFAGRRRRAAIAYHNAGLPNDQSALRMRVRIWPASEATDIIRKALHENLKRRQMNPMQIARTIQKVRKLKNWEGGKHTKLVATYFGGKSPAWITQHEKLLTLPDEVQARAAELGMDSDPAQFLATEVKPEAQAPVLQRAEELAAEESNRKSVKKPTTKSSSSQPSQPSQKPTIVKAGGKGKEKPQVEKKHIEKAARENDALNQIKPLSRGGILDFFNEIADSPAYGYGSSPIRQFASYFVGRFAAGTGSERTAMAKFDAACGMTEDGSFPCGMGEPSKTELKAQQEEDAAAQERVSKKPKTKTAGKSK